MSARLTILYYTEEKNDEFDATHVEAITEGLDEKKGVTAITVTPFGNTIEDTIIFR